MFLGINYYKVNKKLRVIISTSNVHLQRDSAKMLEEKNVIP